MRSFLQLELEGLCAPLSDITVQHGALGEADVVLAVNQDHGIGPEAESENNNVNDTDLYHIMDENILICNCSWSSGSGCTLDFY